MYWPVAIEISFKYRDIFILALVAMLLPVLVKGIMRNISVKIILNLNHWLRRCHLKTFLSENSGGPLCDGAEPFV